MAAPPSNNWDMTAALTDLTAWLIQQGLGNTPVETWLETFCVRLVEIGIPLHVGNILYRLHVWCLMLAFFVCLLPQRLSSVGVLVAAGARVLRGQDVQRA